MDSPNIKPEMTLSITIKSCNDTSGINGLSATILVFGIIPRIHINTKELPDHSERIKAVKAASEEMSSMICIDRIKTALARNVQSVADSELVEGTEVVMYGEELVCELVDPYVVYKRDEKMLYLGTSEIFIEASLNKGKRYYANKSSLEKQGGYKPTRLDPGNSEDNHNEEVKRLPDQFMPTEGHGTGNEVIGANELFVRILPPNDERAAHQDFKDAK